MIRSTPTAPATGNYRIVAARSTIRFQTNHLFGLRCLDVPAVRDLPPGSFALVMASGVCSTALLYVGHPLLSGALLAITVAAFVVLCVAVALRVVRYPGAVRADLAAPDRTYGFFTFVAACNVLAVRLAASGCRVTALVLALIGAVAWLVLNYAVPVGLILGPRSRPVLAGVNGMWFVWVVGTQSLAVSAAVLGKGAGGWAALTAVAMWSVGVVLYLVVAVLVPVRLLLLEVRPEELTAPYWVVMGATAITVLAASSMLRMVPDQAIEATRPVVAGLAMMLWAFGTWLIPLLVAFSVWRYRLYRAPGGYTPALWGMVFPLGMYATASMDLGYVARLRIVADIGRAWTWLAVGVWAIVFIAMCRHLLRAIR